MHNPIKYAKAVLPDIEETMMGDCVEGLLDEIAKLKKARDAAVENQKTVVRSGTNVRTRLLTAEGILRRNELYDLLDGEAETLWVTVSEQLPVEEGTYIGCYVPQQYANVPYIPGCDDIYGVYFDGKAFVDVFTLRPEDFITHWMPLPFIKVAEQ